MTKAITPLTNKEIRQLYSQRIRAFLTQVEKWLPEELGMFQSTPNFAVTDITGTYPIEMATLYKKDVPAPDNVVADIIPLGIITPLGGGMLEICGAFDEERLYYFRENTVPLLEDEPGMFYPIFFGVESDGWYWLDSSMNKPAVLITDKLLFNLIDMVNNCVNG